MDQDDAEKRIAELEQRLGERQLPADVPAPNPYTAGASRQFAAFPPFWGSRWNPKRGMTYMYGGLALFGIAMLGLGALSRQSRVVQELSNQFAYPVMNALLGLAVFGYFALFRRHTRRKIFISVTGDGLTVSQRPGEVFPFKNAQLGQWAYSMVMGTALHLSSGPNHYVVGGRDHRPSRDMRLAAQPTQQVDAWLWAADFDELLTVAGPACGFEARGAARPPQAPGPGPGEPIRCLLFPNPEVMSVQPFWAFLRVQRMARSFQSAQQPTLAIDVSADTMWVVDPTDNALKASARLAQVTAQPENYILRRGNLGSDRMFSDAYLKQTGFTTPVLVVHAPGLEPVSIGCPDMPSEDYIGYVANDLVVRRRFSWRGKVPRRINRPADYVVSGADWLTLVERVGLAPYLDDTESRFRH